MLLFGTVAIVTYTLGSTTVVVVEAIGTEFIIPGVFGYIGGITVALAALGIVQFVRGIE